LKSIKYIDAYDEEEDFISYDYGTKEYLFRAVGPFLKNQDFYFNYNFRNNSRYMFEAGVVPDWKENMKECHVV